MYEFVCEILATEPIWETLKVKPNGDKPFDL
jgi:hypothetical protein